MLLASPSSLPHHIPEFAFTVLFLRSLNHHLLILASLGAANAWLGTELLVGLLTLLASIGRGLIGPSWLSSGWQRPQHPALPESGGKAEKACIIPVASLQG